MRTYDLDLEFIKDSDGEGPRWKICIHLYDNGIPYSEEETDFCIRTVRESLSMYEGKLITSNLRSEILNTIYSKLSEA